MTTKQENSTTEELTSTALLRVSQLTKRFGGHVALDSLSFDVKGGETFGIAGPNGAGKSTLVNVCTGAISFEQGDILLAGESLRGLATHNICKRKMSRTFQIPKVFSSITVYENIKIGLDFGNTRRPHDADSFVETLLDATDLNSYRNHKASHLPLLRKKLTMLAAVLALEPELVFLDEPLAGLTQAEIVELISMLQKLKTAFNLTLVIIEHKVRALLELADTLMILHYGQLLDLGVPRKVVSNERVKEVYLGSASYV